MKQQHTCKYCGNHFEARAGAYTCSTKCRVGYAAVVKYSAVWGLTLPTTESKQEPQPTPAKPPKDPIIKPKEHKHEQIKPTTQKAQETSSERWARVQAYKNRHKF